MPSFEEVDASVPATRLPTGVQQMAADLLPAAGDHVVFTRPLIEGGVPCVPYVQGFHVLSQTPTTEIVARGAVGVVEKIFLNHDPDVMVGAHAAVRVGANAYNVPLHLSTVTMRADKASNGGTDSSSDEAVADPVATTATDSSSPT